MPRAEPPARAPRAPSPPAGEKDGMRGYGSWRGMFLARSGPPPYVGGYESRAGLALDDFVIRGQNFVHDGRAWHGLPVERANGHDSERTGAEEDSFGFAQRFRFDDAFVCGQVERLAQFQHHG